MAVLFLLVAALGIWGPVSAIAEEEVGRMTTIEGDVLVRNEVKKRPVQKAKVGDVLQEGDIVNTGSNGKAKILMKDQSVVDLQESTLFKVDEFKLKNGADRSVTMSMDYGSIRANIKKKIDPTKGKFFIRTQAATMGVRGTEFLVSSDVQSIMTGAKAEPSQRPATTAPPPQTKVVVVEGQVEVQSPGASPGAKPKAVSLDAGKELVTSPVNAENAPQVRTLNPTEVKSLQAQATVVDKTFEKTVVVKTDSDGGAGGAGTLGQIASYMESLDLSSLDLTRDLLDATLIRDFQIVTPFIPPPSQSGETVTIKVQLSN